MESYQELFDAYVAEMRVALAEAGKWWTFLQARQAVSPSGADRPTLAERWPFGAVSHPFVIDCYRRWSLACQALNDRLDSDEDDDDDTEDDSDDESEAAWGREDTSEDDLDLRGLEPPVEPRELLIDMLPGRTDDVAAALALFVFDPVGMDKEDRLV